jgi:5S rRNA maturation endonuclease (ribonuclease M5)
VKDPADVLEALEGALADLVEAARSGAVLVEGRRDVAALDQLGVGGAVEVLNRGSPLLAVCDELASRHRGVTVLTDWDEKGDELARQVAGGLRRASVSVDLETRDALKRLTRGQVHAVEELPSFHRRVVAAAASKGPSVKTATDWKARKELTIARRAERRQRGGPPGRRR